ncbi:MAG: zincin-like metallopeptidase domain-containing protein [Bacteroidetes bacterium]|nr:zincin-like metallopeptidase domain-containing protein [Bacteroidota bacterium]
MSETQTPKKLDVYQTVTDRIIEELERGKVPWQQPWIGGVPPQNLISGKWYRGINSMLLNSLNYSRNYFLSFQQVQDLGGRVLKGEKAHMIVFWKIIEKEDEVTKEKVKKSFLRYYLVFNVDQCKDIPMEKIPEVMKKDHHSIPACEDIVNGMPLKPEIIHGEKEAWYSPAKDCINMPPMENFHYVEGYYATLFHELIHSTGHPSRLERKELISLDSTMGSENYSIEELTAEIGSCYLNSFAGIALEIKNSVGYIQHWLEKLKEDKRFIVYASSQAQKAVDFILNPEKVETVEPVLEEVGNDDLPF